MTSARQVEKIFKNKHLKTRIKSIEWGEFHMLHAGSEGSNKVYSNQFHKCRVLPFLDETIVN